MKIQDVESLPLTGRALLTYSGLEQIKSWLIDGERPPPEEAEEMSYETGVDALPADMEYGCPAGGSLKGLKQLGHDLITFTGDPMGADMPALFTACSKVRSWVADCRQALVRGDIDAIEEMEDDILAEVRPAIESAFYAIVAAITEEIEAEAKRGKRHISADIKPGMVSFLKEHPGERFGAEDILDWINIPGADKSAISNIWTELLGEDPEHYKKNKVRGQTYGYSK